MLRLRYGDERASLSQMDDLASDKPKFTKLLTHNKCAITISIEWANM